MAGVRGREREGPESTTLNTPTSAFARFLQHWDTVRQTPAWSRYLFTAVIVLAFFGVRYVSDVFPFTYLTSVFAVVLDNARAHLCGCCRPLPIPHAAGEAPNPASTGRGRSDRSRPHTRGTLCSARAQQQLRGTVGSWLYGSFRKWMSWRLPH
jgi:hypothetical protein